MVYRSHCTVGAISSLIWYRLVSVVRVNEGCRASRRKTIKALHIHLHWRKPSNLDYGRTLITVWDPLL